MLVVAGWVKAIVVELWVGQGRRRGHIVDGLAEEKGFDDDVFVAGCLWSYLLVAGFLVAIYYVIL